jgi:hypothetical protein
LWALVLFIVRGAWLMTVARMLIGVLVCAAGARASGPGMAVGATAAPTVITAGGDVGAIAVAGPVLAVGSVATGSTSGVELFGRSRGGWTPGPPLAELTASDAMPSDGVGSSLASDGDAVVALRPQAGGYDGVPATPAKLYVFTKPAGGWAGTSMSPRS